MKKKSPGVAADVAPARRNEGNMALAAAYVIFLETLFDRRDIRKLRKLRCGLVVNSFAQQSSFFRQCVLAGLSAVRVDEFGVVPKTKRKRIVARQVERFSNFDLMA